MAMADLDVPWDADDILSGGVMANTPQSWKNVNLVVKGESDFENGCV